MDAKMGSGWKFISVKRTKIYIFTSCFCSLNNLELRCRVINHFFPQNEKAQKRTSVD